MSDSNKIVSSFNFVYLSTFNLYSSAGFQGLRDSGVLKDLVEAVISSGFNRDSAMKYIYDFAHRRLSFVDRPRKPVSARQIVELLASEGFNKMFDDAASWINFFDLLSFLSGASVWFETNKLDWMARDKFREGLGLKALNPILENSEGLRIIFKSDGKCDVWESPPAGYRYAILEEVSSVGKPNEDNRPTFIFHNNKWGNLWRGSKRDDGNYYVYNNFSFDEKKMFGKSQFLIAIVKL